MGRQIVQFARGNTAANDAFTGAEGELSYDTVAKKIRIHDGSTAGGKIMATEEDVGALVASEVAAEVPGAVSAALAGIGASGLTFAPAGTVEAETVQDAIEELDGDIQARQIADAAIAPTSLSANQNNYAPTGHAGASVWFLTSDSTVRTITGLQGGVAGRKLTLYNANTATPILLANDSGSSDAANRFDLGLSVVVIPAKTAVNLVYGGATARWRLAGFNSPAQRASFSAHKNGTSQTVTTTNSVKVTFGTEVYDNGSRYSSSAWTPFAGPIEFGACLELGNLSSAQTVVLRVYKNGANFLHRVYSNAIGFDESYSIHIQDEANGADTYELYVQTSDSNYIIKGSTATTWLYGSMR